MTRSLLLLVALATVATCRPRTLVILENVLTKETHSSFLADLGEKDTDVTYKYATDSSLTIKKYGERVYDSIIVLAPSVAAFGNALTPTDFLDFVDAGGNLVLTASNKVGEPIREIAAEVGVEIDEAGTSVIDHMNYDVTDEGDHDLIVADDFINTKVIVGESPAPVLFKGVGMAADLDNPLVIDILKASQTAYSHSPDQDILEYPLAIGSSLLLVAGMQARNNARVVVFGSHDMLSDAFYIAKAQTVMGGVKEAGNKAFASAVTDWALKRNGDLRFGTVKHNKVGEAPSDAAYRITDDAEYSITIEEMQNGKWAPFQAKDVQMEFVRIDPFVRAFLVPDAAGVFKVAFKVPDVYGVFQFKVNYDRTGYTHLYSTTQVSVRPFRHTEYERFIPSAYPYYASAFSMMGGLIVFSFIFLYHQDKPKTE